MPGMATNSQPVASVGSARSPLESACWCVAYGSGIILMLVIYGLLQERIMTQTYDGDKFKISLFLVLCNRLVAVMYAFSMTVGKGESLQSKAALWKYAAISVSNVYASACQYEALKYVSFPVQMLGKSFKMMPVMVWGIVISGKRYTCTDWLIAAAVTGGVTEFLMTGPIESSGGGGNSMFGLGLLGCFLALDGFTSTFQEKLFREDVTTKYNQMLYINTFSSIIAAVSLVVAGQVHDAMAFVGLHPPFAADVGTLSAAAVAGQYFIYSQVQEFGALAFAATMNVRQVVSILISYATYGHSITALQILGLALVFGGLFYKSFLGLIASEDKTGEKAKLLPDTPADSEKGEAR